MHITMITHTERVHAPSLATLSTDLPLTRSLLGERGGRRGLFLMSSESALDIGGGGAITS